MLERAIKHQSEINEFFRDVSNEEYLKYYFFGGRAYSNFELVEDEYSAISRVSTLNGELLGIISCDVFRWSRIATSFVLINFTKHPNPVFARDTLQFVEELFHRYGLKKISFKVASDNKSAKKQYERFIANHGGRKVGVLLQDVCLMDGTYSDVDLYEILEKDYF